jgi:general secretion pathway protein D
MFGCVNRVWRRFGIALAPLSICTLLIGCSGLDQYFDKNGTEVPGETVSDEVMSRDLTARHPAAAAPRRADAPLPAAQIFSGEGAQSGAGQAPVLPATGTAQEAVPRGADRFDLNFQNADVAAASKVLLGDLLKVNYSLDPRVQGTINLMSGRPVAKADVLPLYESVLKLINAQIVYEGSVYKVVPAGEALGAGGIDTGSRVTAGYGISVLPLQFVSANTVLRAIDSFAVKPGAARIAPNRNLLIIQGSSTERASAIEAALALDVDWMKNQAVGIFPVRNATPDTMISELQNVFDAGREGAAANVVRFQPISRLNAVLAIAPSTEVINRVRNWVTRLDRADYEDSTVRVYRLRYGNAKVLAGVLREVFTGQPNTAASASNSDLAQLTPGSTAERMTSPGGSGQTQQSSQPNPAIPGISGSGNQSVLSGQQNRGAGRGIDLASISNSSPSAGPPLLSNVRITADIANNSLLIYANREQYKIVERAIFELDRAPLQVAIDVTVAEITLKNELQYGVQFYLQDIKNGNQQGSIGFGLSSVLARTIPGGNLVLGSDTDPRVVLNALRAITDVHVVSSPALVVLDNQQAVLQVGDQVPITTSQQQSTLTSGAPIVNSIEMRDTGVILKVTPRVNANGVVNLDVSQEVSAVQPQTDPTLTPTISERKVQSSIAVASGQTVLLAGMISTQTQNKKQALPVLGDLKGIGDLFGSNDKQSQRTELIVFIRPQIIRNGTDAQLVAEELRSKLSVVAREAAFGHPPKHSFGLK